MARITCGSGFIIVPPDVDRVKYIDSCYASGKVSMYPETGGTSYNEVPISTEALQSIEFPEEGQILGSQVIYVMHPLVSYPIIIAVISKNNENAVLGWKEFKLQKSDKSNLVSIIGQGSKGNLLVNINSDKADGGKVVVNIRKSSKDAKFELHIQGAIYVRATSAISLITDDTFRIRAKNKVFIGNRDESEEIGSDNGFQAIMLGNNLSDWVKDLCSLLKELTVATGVGPSGFPLPDWTAKLDNLYNKFEENLSKKVFVE